MIKIGYFYQGKKEYIKELLCYDLIFLIDDDKYVNELIEYNKNIKIIKYVQEEFDILISENDDFRNIYARKKVVIGKFKEKKKRMKYIETFDIEEIFKEEKKEDIDFSIVMPNYNNEKWLRYSIESILNQTYKKWKLYIIDDISTDNSVSVIKKYKDSRIELIQNEIKLYNGGSRNVGILKAKKENPDGYILFIDSDDWWDNNNFLEDLNKFIEDDDVITYEYKYFMDNKIQPAGHFSYRNIDDMFMTKGIICACWCKAVKVDLIPLFSFNTLMEDRVHWYRTVNRIRSYEHFDRYQVYVWNKMNNNSVTTNKNQQYKGKWQTKIEWNNCAYRHIADMLDFLEEIEKPIWKDFIKDKIDSCKNKCNNNIFQQF